MNKRDIFKLLIFVLSIIILVSPAQSQGKAPSERRKIISEKRDLNGDGQTTEQEFIDSYFTQHDKDDDGYITEQELGDKLEVIDNSDKDGDRRLSQAEYLVQFTSKDKNKDGIVTPDEDI